MTRVEIIIKALTAMKDDCNYSLAIHNETGNYFYTEESKVECENTIIKIDDMLKDLEILERLSIIPGIKNGTMTRL